MIHVFLTIFLSATLFSAENIDAKIIQKNRQIKSISKKQNLLNSSLSKVAKDILVYERNLLKLKKRINKLSAELKEKEGIQEHSKSELKKMTLQQKNLMSEQNEIKEKLVFLLAKHLTLSQVIDEESARNHYALMTEESLKVLNSITKNEFNKLQLIYIKNDRKMMELKGEISLIQSKIDSIKSNRVELNSSKERQRQLIKRLDSKHKNYEKSLKSVINRRMDISKTLENLQIIKKKKLEREAEEREKNRQFKQLERRKKIVDNKNLPKVKTHTSGYKKSKTVRYRGKKTIAPLSSYRVIKKYGPYIDPVYNMKIFNESVSLKPTSSDTKVKNVLNGKVVLAKKTPVLKNIIIMQHSNGIHTIYANLNKIARTVKKGKKLKKGSILGKVNDELMFEVTQKNYHINPMDLIK